MFKYTILFAFALLVAVVSSYPMEDLDAAATDHHHHGRVQIKVFRGPSEGHEHFAPWGYWVKQPADADNHH